jgi:hypothetical protein
MSFPYERAQLFQEGHQRLSGGMSHRSQRKNHESQSLMLRLPPGIAAEELRAAVIAPVDYPISHICPQSHELAGFTAKIGRSPRAKVCTFSARVPWSGLPGHGRRAPCAWEERGECVGQLGESSWSWGIASARLSRVIWVTVAAVMGAHAPINASHASVLSLPIYPTSIPRSTCERPLSDHPGANAPAQEVVQNSDPLFDPAGLSNHGGPTLRVALQPTSPAIKEVPRSAR